MNGEMKDGNFEKFWKNIFKSYLDYEQILLRILKPNETEKKDVLIKTLSEILWEAGEKMFACVAQNSFQNCFETSGYGFNAKSNYYGDGLTERVRKSEWNI